MEPFLKLAGLDFVTQSVTRKNYVTMKTSFYLRKKNNKYAYIFLNLFQNKCRERFSTGIECKINEWNHKQNRLKETSEENKSINLQLGYIEGKINKILLNYFANETPINPKILKKELLESSNRVSFFAYFTHILEIKKTFFCEGTYKRYCSVMNNLFEFRKEIYFRDLSISFFDDYRFYLKDTGREDTTIAANFNAIKSVLKHAVRDGIYLSFDVSEIKSGSTKGKKIPLNVMELQKVFKYFESELCKDRHKLVLGYFLLGCFSGMRFSDIMKIKTDDIANESIYFISQKTNKEQTLQLNNKAKIIIENCPMIFKQILTNQYINRELKDIFTFLGIRKKVSFHTSRHTFAVNFLRSGGKVENLQVLLGHSDIRETMGYVYILANEANKDIHKMDDLF